MTVASYDFDTEIGYAVITYVSDEQKVPGQKAGV
jgi:hypothetical protein